MHVVDESPLTLLLIYLSIAIGVSFLCSVLEAVLLSITCILNTFDKNVSVCKDNYDQVLQVSAFGLD